MGRNLEDLIIFIGKRFLQLLPVLLGVIVLTFLVTHVAAVDPCPRWYPKASHNVLLACEAQFKLPLWTQFWDYFSQLLVGNWGTSQLGTPVFPVIAAAVPATLELVIASMFLMIVIGIPLGVIAAQYAGRWGDHLVRVLYLSGWSVPTYVGAVVAAVYLAPAVGLPTSGEYSVYPPPFPQVTHMSILDAIIAGNFPYTIDAINHLILPAGVLAFINMGIATRMTRATMLEVLPLDYVKAARMKGLSNFIVLYKHALRNALIATVTVLGLTAGGLLAGTVVIEEVFSWPGIGAYAFEALGGAGVPNFDGAIAVVVVFSIGVVVANLLSDILYGILDPRVEWR
ncbi:MAG TPA: ABC transporter permease [Thermoplasmata archaeon]|jgi:peptide/nickel transport system permease protein|nr:ABC transporter permease [Thermoplasmata archaeon]